MTRSLTLTLTLALSLTGAAARGDILVDFSDLSYPHGSYDPTEKYPAGPAPGTGSYDNGYDLKGGFTSNGVFFSNTYYGSGGWGGWGYSNVNDPTTTGASPDLTDYTHQFAAVTGTAPGGSGNYAIESGTGAYIDLPSGASPVSFLVTNTTYDYLSMALGDKYAKKFGVGDAFTLKVFGYTGPDGTGSQVGEVDVPLANYTSADSKPLSVWTSVDLTPLAGVASLGFDFASTDNDPVFGPNTPLSFAMDDLKLATSAVPEPSSVALLLAGLPAAVFARRVRRTSAR